MSTMSTGAAGVVPAAAGEVAIVRPGISRWAKLRRLPRRQPLGVFGLIVILVLILTAIFAHQVARYDPTSTQFGNLRHPNATNYFGTDDKGRDVFSRVVYGSRTSLEVGIIATTVGVLGGMIVGLISGYFGGWVDMVIQRVMDAMMAFPVLILALIMIAVVGSSIRNLMIVVGAAIIPGIGRIVRSIVLSEKQNVYVEAARTLGARPERIIFRHVLPNLLAPLIVIATSLLAGAILVEASLSFLGLGTPPPTPSWGADLSGQARRFFTHAPWMAIFPGAALSLVVLGFNLLGDALRDILDPRLRGAR
ncbi:MAG TPA: ABC transporter permease [Dehalococcoidia bacterium]|nr:ABC transporter permease [Dehalococcoidia bacterium]